MRGLVMREIPKQKVWRLILKESALGIINGAIIGTVTALVAWLWHGNPYLGLVIGLGMLVNLFFRRIGRGVHTDYHEKCRIGSCPKFQHHFNHGYRRNRFPGLPGFCRHISAIPCLTVSGKDVSTIQADRRTSRASYLNGLNNVQYL